MLEPISTDRHVSVITHIIEYLRLVEQTTEKGVYLQIDNLQLTPALEADLSCVGLGFQQYNDCCIISWRDALGLAKNAYHAEKENQSLKAQGPAPSKDGDN